MTITAEQLRDARQFASLTQAELAEALDVSQRTIVNWESEQGAGVPRKAERRVLALLGEALHMIAKMPPSTPWESSEPPSWLANAGPVDPSPVGDELAAQYRRRRAALEPFTDLDLIVELRDRARDRGEVATDWSTAAMDARNVGDLTEDDVHVTPEGPGAGYALAAKRGRKKAHEPHAD